MYCFKESVKNFLKVINLLKIVKKKCYIYGNIVEMLSLFFLDFIFVLDNKY